MSVRRKFVNVIKGLFPELSTRIIFRRTMHRALNLSNPQRFDDKIQWLKLNVYRDSPFVTCCADKFLAREYVEKCGCGDILNDLIGVWDSPDQIEWEKLPDRFVLKCNHGCHYNYLCSERTREHWPTVQNKLKEWMSDDYWKRMLELQYKGIRKKIICETFLGDGHELYDYKFYCFNGIARYVMVCVGREAGRPKFFFFDREWSVCPISRDAVLNSDVELPKPDRFDDMLLYADKLSAPFPFVRVDLYNTEGRVFFGELTFTPSAGMDVNRLESTDFLFGGLLNEKTGLRDAPGCVGT